MKLPFQLSTITWLCPDTKEQQPLNTVVDIHESPIPMEPSIGVGVIDLSSFHFSIKVIHTRIFFNPQLSQKVVPIAHFQAALTDNMLEFYFLNKGTLIIENQQSHEKLRLGCNVLLSRNLSEVDYICSVETSSDFELASISISTQTLNEFLGKELANSLLKKLKISSVHSNSILNLPAHFKNLLFEGLKAQGPDKVHKIYIQSVLLELLYQLINYLTTKLPSVNSSNRHKVMQLHDSLIKIDGRTPSIDVMAKQNNISAKTMTDNFRRIYGQSIRSYFIDVKLTKAHQDLVQNKMSIKEIAYKAGYSHVNNFSNAFKRKYAYTPGSIRK